MASSDESAGAMPPGDGSVPPGKAKTVGQSMVDKGAQLMQSLKPIQGMKLHACTFASYSHDMNRQIETHHFITRLNQDFLQSAVYDSDESSGRLIGIEYIISDRLFEDLPPDEQKLWHSHAYEITSGLWVNPRMPDMMQNSEISELAKTYGKFWCTWQVDRGDRLPLGAPALMMSPQAEKMGKAKPELVHKRDSKYKISSDDLIKSRLDIGIPESINPKADYWQQSGKGFAIDIEHTDMKLRTLFP